MKARLLTLRRSFLAVVALPFALLSLGCADPGSDEIVLTPDLPLHLEDHLDAARIEGSEVPEDVPPAVEWRFDEPQPGWHPIGYAESQPARLTQLEDALRLDITDANYFTSEAGVRTHDGWIYIDVPGLRREDWGHVSVRARAQPGISFVALWFNLTDRSDPSQTPY